MVETPLSALPAFFTSSRAFTLFPRFVPLAALSPSSRAFPLLIDCQTAKHLQAGESIKRLETVLANILYRVAANVPVDKYQNTESDTITNLLNTPGVGLSICLITERTCSIAFGGASCRHTFIPPPRHSGTSPDAIRPLSIKSPLPNNTSVYFLCHPVIWPERSSLQQHSPQ